jgi:hypothetical protein
VTVPLSEREQQILDQIEKDLYQEDPGFAREVRKRSPRSKDIARARLGAGLFLLGLVTLFVFFYSSAVFVGVIAFGAMVGGIVLLAGSARGVAAARRGENPSAKERAAHAFSRWEDGLKKRYRKD